MTQPTSAGARQALQSPLAPLVLGTHNRKKAAELADLFVPSGLRVSTLVDFPHAPDVEETGHSFAENAIRKATCQAAQLRSWVLGDDSGLVVDALDGEPGIYSARFAGENATDELNRRQLLARLVGAELPRRDAHFVCHLALADPRGTVRAQSTGRCYGRILAQEAGSGGFGYDPLFEIVEYHRTFAQLGAAKSCLSHRARAIQAILPQIAELIASGQWVASG
jgi:XTP/dITP diphosphohydrolase